MEPIEVFFSYSHLDEDLFGQLRNHLKQLEHDGIIRGWYDRFTPPGEKWAGPIDKHLDSAEIILLLISSNYTASSYCQAEMKHAMARQKNGGGMGRTRDSPVHRLENGAIWRIEGASERRQAGRFLARQ